jgi:hypothetical protein
MTGQLHNTTFYILGKAAELGEFIADLHCRYPLPEWITKLAGKAALYYFILELSKLGAFGERIAEIVKAILG